MITPDYWFRIITEIERHMSLRQAAARVDSSASSLCRFKAGEVEPRYSVGHRLIALHRLLPCICSTSETRPAQEYAREPTPG